MRPTWLVGLHAFLVGAVALVGLIFLANPCGGGDLCLGGIVALWAFGFAGWGAVGLVVWRAARRAGPLLAFDAVVIAVTGDMVLSIGGWDTSLLAPASLAALLAALGASVLAGRAVALHRFESVLVVMALVVILALAGAGGLAVLIAGVLALGAGWLANRLQPREAGGGPGAAEADGAAT